MSQIQFIHRRPVAGDCGPASRGGFTIAYQEIKPGLVEYSIANCSPRDNFNKKIGRDIATGRLVNSNNRAVRESTVEDFREEMYSVDV
jgi:hypothetical protein